MTTTPTSMMSKATITCMSIDCAERFSLCCHAGSERGKRGFVCKACKEPFKGGRCNGYDLSEVSPPAIVTQYRQPIGSTLDCKIAKQEATPPAKREEWEKGFDNIFNSKGIDHVDHDGKIRIELKSFTRSTRFQAYEEGRGEAIKKIEKKLNKIRNKIWKMTKRYHKPHNELKTPCPDIVMDLFDLESDLLDAIKGKEKG